MSRLPDTIKDALDIRKGANSLRTLVDHHQLVDFSSNDYLGLARNRDLADEILKRSEEIDLPTGGTGSRLISGNFDYYTQVENDLARIFGCNAALLYNSGYAANQGVLACLGQKGDTILYDQLAHVCIKEGAWLSKADTFSFKHNDLYDLERKLKRAKGNVYVATETVFSMDGDSAPLEEIVALSEKYGAYLIVDEAHSTGIYGEGGAGMVAEKGLQEHVLATIYTFGKAIGTHGACVAGDQQLIDFLVNFSRSFIYTTSLPPHSVLSIKQSFEFISSNPGLKTELLEKIGLFRKEMEGSFEVTSSTAIQPIKIPGNSECRELATYLQKQGYDVRAILAPTVKEGTERLRISLHVHNTEEEIRELTRLIKSYKN